MTLRKGKGKGKAKSKNKSGGQRWLHSDGYWRDNRDRGNVSGAHHGRERLQIDLALGRRWQVVLLLDLLPPPPPPVPRLSFECPEELLRLEVSLARTLTTSVATSEQIAQDQFWQTTIL